MKILYLGFWGSNDPLTKATIRPTLDFLEKLSIISSITFVSIERKGHGEKGDHGYDKIQEINWRTFSSIKLIQNIWILIFLPLFISRRIKKDGIELLICRSAPAGGIGYLAHKLSGIKFWVESFEPHSQYMADNKIWSRSNPIFGINRWLEQMQINNADKILTVSHNFKEFLNGKFGIGSKVEVLPCTIDLKKFSFQFDDRVNIRRKLNISDEEILFVYLGKFGGLYYLEETFLLFSKLIHRIDHSRILILTPQEHDWVRENVINHGIDTQKITIKTVSHQEVVQYLSAADMALCPVRKTKSSKFCSPVKMAEYWANGLPVILPQDIGDDSFIIETEGGGIIMDFEYLKNFNYQKLVSMCHEYGKNRLSNMSVKLGEKFRSDTQIEKVYKNILT